MQAFKRQPKVLIISDDLQFKEYAETLMAAHGINVTMQSADQLPRFIDQYKPDLLVIDMAIASTTDTMDLKSWVLSQGDLPSLFMVNQNQLAELNLMPSMYHDFIVNSATKKEFLARCIRLLHCNSDTEMPHIVTVDDMEINFATYQVTIGGRSVDLTLMEYNLLAYLVTHSERVHSRAELLWRVWGFEYGGGTRTVDVHIRRVRAKVGPHIASHIQTVRGVGYIFKA